VQVQRFAFCWVEEGARRQHQPCGAFAEEFAELPHVPECGPEVATEVDSQLPEVLASALVQELLNIASPSATAGESLHHERTTAAAKALTHASSGGSLDGLEVEADARVVTDAAAEAEATSEFGAPAVAGADGELVRLPTESASPVEDAVLAQQVSRIMGNTFQPMRRLPGCVTAAFADPSSLRTAERALAVDPARFWNVAHEAQVVGAARHVLVSGTAMAPAGVFRLDVRVVSGVEAEAAHLLEVGICTSPQLACTSQLESQGQGGHQRRRSSRVADPFFASPPSPTCWSKECGCRSR